MDVEDFKFQDLSPDVERREGGAMKRGRKPGRKANPSKTDMRIKLERSRQSARECRARKKLRYQYLEEQVQHREKAVFMLHKELERYRQLAKEYDEGKMSDGIQALIDEENKKRSEGED